MAGVRLPGGVVHPLPRDLRATLLESPLATAAWKDITPLARNEFICWVEDAKQVPTRERRIRRTRGARGGPAAAVLLARVRTSRAHRSLRRGSPQGSLAPASRLAARGGTDVTKPGAGRGVVLGASSTWSDR